MFYGIGEDDTNISYNDEIDLLYIRLENQKQHLVNRRISENIVLDIGENDKIVGIEILNASHQINLEKLLPIEYKASCGTVFIPSHDSLYTPDFSQVTEEATLIRPLRFQPFLQTVETAFVCAISF